MDGNEDHRARTAADAGANEKPDPAADEGPPPIPGATGPGPSAAPDGVEGEGVKGEGGSPAPSTPPARPATGTPAPPRAGPPAGPGPEATPNVAAAPSAGPPPYGASRAAEPKILDLPDEDGGRRPNGDRTLVLGGAAAAEGRTTGPQPRIAGPAHPPDGEPDADGEAAGRHFSSGTSGERTIAWPIVAAAVPILALVLLVGAWAIDTAALSGQVMRNVEIGDRQVGGLGEASLPEVMEEVNTQLAARPVVVSGGDRRYETTAGELGLTVDAEATAEAALDAGRGESLLTRPFSWLGSFFGPRQVPLQYSVKESQLVAKLLELQGPDLLAPHDPTVELVDGAWTAVPGTPGEGIDTDEVAAELPEAADAAGGGSDGGSGDDGDAAGDDEGGAPIEIDAGIVPVAPRFTDEEAQQLADRANELTADGLTLVAGEATKEVDAATLRSWIVPTTENGKLELVIVPETVTKALPQVFSDLSADPKDASFDLQGGTPVVVPSQQGIACCGSTSPDVIWQALTEGTGTAELEVQVTEPELTTEEAQALGIKQAVGGNQAWRNGAPSTAGPGFTTYHDCCAARVTNIHRMADIVRGSIVLPGETFSVNDVVGQRTAAKGFVPAGAIAYGEHVDEIGGGVSQFATTTFNAAYFAGLEIPVYQAHSEYFPRYPLGREATMGYPNPDLQFTNDTPYGILVWTSYTDTSLTVTLYSTPHATGEQTGISESMEDQCRVVTTTRTRTWPDGRTENDTFRARYRPGPNLGCDGKPITPP